ncbi:putative glycoside hydrolase [Patescibacteria group bacterium]
MAKTSIFSKYRQFIINLSNIANKAKISCFLVTLILLMSFLLLNSTNSVHAKNDGYPKLANYFLKTPINQAEVYELAKWDVVILGMQAQDTSPEIFSQLRELNPNIKIIAYLSAMEFPIVNIGNLESVKGPWHRMYQQIDSKWYLKDGSGNIHSIWPGNYSFNITKYCPDYNNQKFNEFLPKFVKDTLMSTGKWDGVFYDNVLDGIKFTNNGQVDINNDFKIDDQVWADQAWREGALTLLNNTRKALGNNKIILVNSSSYGKDYINGRLYESWPDPWQGGWTGSMQDYASLEKNILSYPQIIILNPNTNNTGVQNAQKIRFGITSTLMGDGYFAYDYGTQDHSQVWHYTEYDVALGNPINSAYNTLNKNSSSFVTGVWRRDFTNGLALVNSTNKTQIINLEKEYTRIDNAQKIKTITLLSEDGIILLGKPIVDKVVPTPSVPIPETPAVLTSDFEPDLTGVVFTNGSYVRAFDKRGNLKASSFYAYDKRFPDGAQIVYTDFQPKADPPLAENIDKENEIVVANKSKIQVFKNNGLLISEFYPYGENYTKGINLAIGNVTGDDSLEIVTGVQKGSAPFVRVFDMSGKVINNGFMAYAENFFGGVKIALGDLNGNGYKEIVVGAGYGGGPHVRIFNADSHLFDPGFFPYDPEFRGGINVSCMDLNGDGKDEIITGAGRGGGPHVQIYDKIGHLVDPGFFCLFSSFT